MSFGVMGGTMQPQGHAQLVVRIADYGQNPQAACDGPRFRWVKGMEMNVEGGLKPEVVAETARRGHQLTELKEGYMDFGSCQAAWKLDGGYLAVSDPAPRRAGRRILIEGNATC